MSDVIVAGGSQGVYWGGGFEKAEVEAFMAEEEAVGESGGSGGSSSSWDPGSSGLPIAPWDVFSDPYTEDKGTPWALDSDPSDSSVVVAGGSQGVYPGGGFEKVEVEAFMAEVEAAGGEVAIAPPTECLSNFDCFPDSVCVFLAGAEGGICIPRGDVGVRIRGVIDAKTCPYCLQMIGMTGSLDSVPLPPYHKYCRCYFEYLE